MISTSMLINLIKYIMITIFSYLCYINGHTFYQERVNNKKIYPKVFDIGHKFLPNFHGNLYLETLLNGMVVLGPFITEFILGYKILDDYIYYLAIILIIRMVMINITILPPIKECLKKDENGEDIHKFGIKELFNGHCYDKIFSGHFASVFLFILILYSKNIFTNIPVLTLYAVFNAILILITRYHYTIDIVVAMLVTLLVYLHVPKIDLSNLLK
jgi:hypothetical protein